MRTSRDRRGVGAPWRRSAGSVRCPREDQPAGACWGWCVGTERARWPQGTTSSRERCGWGRCWGLSVGIGIHRWDGGVEAGRPQCVQAVWRTVSPRWLSCWSVGYPRRGQAVPGFGDELGKNGGRGGRRSYPGCARKLSTGCGFCVRRHGGVEDGRDGARRAAQPVKSPAVLGISLWTRSPEAPLCTVREVCVKSIPSLWINDP